MDINQSLVVTRIVDVLTVTSYEKYEGDKGIDVVITPDEALKMAAWLQKHALELLEEFNEL